MLVRYHSFACKGKSHSFPSFLIETPHFSAESRCEFSRLGQPRGSRAATKKDSRRKSGRIKFEIVFTIFASFLASLSWNITPTASRHGRQDLKPTD